MKKFEKTPSFQQVKELMILLQIWPTASNKACEQFVLQKLGVRMSRAALQTARARLGLTIPEYTEETLKKQAYVKLILSAYREQHGDLISKEEALKEVRWQLKDYFGGDTNSILLTLWVDDWLVQLKSSSCKDLRTETEEDLRKLGIETKQKHTKQQELL